MAIVSTAKNRKAKVNGSIPPLIPANLQPNITANLLLQMLKDGGNTFITIRILREDGTRSKIKDRRVDLRKRVLKIAKINMAVTVEVAVVQEPMQTVPKKLVITIPYWG